MSILKHLQIEHNMDMDDGYDICEEKKSLQFC